MFDDFQLQEVPATSVPAHIAKHLKGLARSVQGRVKRTRRIVEFIEKDSAKDCPTPETFSALLAAARDKKRNVWREQIVAAWVLGQADLTEEQRKEAAEALARLLDYGGKTRGKWQ